MSHKRTLVTCALPYANGPVHIGHLAGAYIPGDIYVRYLRMRGEDVLFICGSDEHGVPITIKAKDQGVTPQDIVDKYHQVMKDALQKTACVSTHCAPFCQKKSSLQILVPRPLAQSTTATRC